MKDNREHVPRLCPADHLGSTDLEQGWLPLLLVGEGLAVELVPVLIYRCHVGPSVVERQNQDGGLLFPDPGLLSRSLLPETMTRAGSSEFLEGTDSGT